MLFGKKEFCPYCGKVVGLLKSRTKEGIAVCRDCVTTLDVDANVIPLNTIESLNVRFRKRVQNKVLFDSFITTSEIKAGVFYLRADANKKLWYISQNKRPTNPSLYRFNELAKFELLEDGDSVCGGGLGRALVGGALFGGFGAIAGAMTAGKKSKKILSSLEIVITTSEPYRPTIRIDLMPFGGKHKSGSLMYDKVMKEAQAAMSFLNSISHKANLDKVQDAETSTSSVGSSADEIIKFKVLLDKGIITEEEFQKKKKKLLGL